MQIPAPAAIREWHDVTPAQFHEEIAPLNQPAVLRGAARDWPLVRAGAASAADAVNYLLRFDRGSQVTTTVAPPAVRGRIFYNDDLSGFNFGSRQQPLAELLADLLTNVDAPDPPAMYVSALDIGEYLPGFTAENALGLLPPSVNGRLWLGNRVTVQTHYDVMLNLACVAAGRRRFTLFPPEQVHNLYVGPLEFTPGGTPVSMVSLDAPDLTRYPRFEAALRVAQSAELGPGDVIHIPYMWWHHVEALTPFNVLVNYWWVDTAEWAGAPFNALIHALLSVRSLSPEKRAAWREWFEHFVFQDGSPVEHLPPDRRGVQATPSAATAARIRGHLIERLLREQRVAGEPSNPRPGP